MRSIYLIPVLLLLAACSSPVANTPVDGSPAIPVSSPVPDATSFFTVTSPVDNFVTDQPQVDLEGNAAVEVVLSVNEEIFVLPPGDFRIPFTLEEGPNTLEIVASDYDGNEFDLILVVIFEP